MNFVNWEFKSERTKDHRAPWVRFLDSNLRLLNIIACLLFFISVILAFSDVAETNTFIPPKMVGVYGLIGVGLWFLSQGKLLKRFRQPVWLFFWLNNEDKLRCADRLPTNIPPARPWVKLDVSKRFPNRYRDYSDVHPLYRDSDYEIAWIYPTDLIIVGNPERTQAVQVPPRVLLEALAACDGYSLHEKLLEISQQRETQPY